MRVISQLMSLSPLLKQNSQENYSALPKPRLRIHFGLIYYFREARLRYFFSNSSKLGITKEASKLLLHELRFRFLSTLAFLWFCHVFDFDSEGEVCFDAFPNFRDSEIWISRQAVLGGIKPRQLDETIDYDFLRNVSQVKIRVWATSNSKGFIRKGGKIPCSQTIQIDERFRFESTHSQPQLIEFEKAEIHHGKFIILGSKLIPISFEQCNPGKSWPSDSYVKSESRLYIMQSKKRNYLSEAIFIGESKSWYHFIVEFLPRYLSIPTEMRNRPTIVSKSINKQSVELLWFLGFRNLVLAELMETIEVDRIITVIDFRFLNPFDFSARKADLVSLQKIFRKIEIPQDAASAHARILILRPNNTFRRMENAKVVVETLEVFGFKAIYPEALSFADQLSIFRSAEIVVGQSGAALTSLLFCNKETKCFELGSWEKEEEQFFWRDFANQIELSIIPIYSQPKSLRQKIHGTFRCNVESLISKLGYST